MKLSEFSIRRSELGNQYDVPSFQFCSGQQDFKTFLSSHGIAN